MGIRTKGRAKLVLDGRRYLWWVRPDDDSAGLLLFVCSEDKRFALTYTVGQSREASPFVVVKGREFPGVPDAGRCWVRVRCPRWQDDARITPGFVRRLIEWPRHNAPAVVRVDWRGEVIETTSPDSVGHGS